MSAAVAAIALLSTIATSASAQGGIWRAPRTTAPSIKFGAFGGANFPVGSTNDGLETGWIGGALIDVTFRRSPLGLRIDGSYQRFGPSFSSANGNVHLWGGDVNLLLMPPRRRMALRPYLTGGVGLYGVTNDVTVPPLAAGAADVPIDDSNSETKFALNGGAGLRYDFAGFGAFLEGRYINVFTRGENTHMVPVTFGIMFGSF